MGWPLLLVVCRYAWHKVECSLITISKYNPDNDEDQNGAETAAAQFFCAVAGDESSEYVVHNLQ